METREVIAKLKKVQGGVRASTVKAIVIHLDNAVRDLSGSLQEAYYGIEEVLDALQGAAKAAPSPELKAYIKEYKDVLKLMNSTEKGSKGMHKKVTKLVKNELQK